MKRLFPKISAAVLVWAAAAPVFAQTGATLENPLKFSSIEQFIEGFLQTIIMIALPIIVAFMVYAGFKYIMARGNSAEIKKAHENFTYVIVGTILILGAWVLSTLIGATVRQILGS